MSSLPFVPSNTLVAAFPLRRCQPSICMAEVQARKVARQAEARTTVLAEMSLADLLSRGLHNALPAGFLSARARIEFGAKHKRGLVIADKFDRTAIMVAAAGAAKAHQARYGSTWAEAMSVSLKAAWQVAKATHRAAAR